MIGAHSFVQIGSEAEERLRLSQITDSAPSASYAIRSLSSLNAPNTTSHHRAAFTLVAPDVQSVNNSRLPFSQNDGPMWAGRGTNMLYTAGVEAQFRNVQLVLAPQFTTSQNLFFQVIPTPQSAGSRNQWANPFHPAESSIDYPLRFGDQSLRRWSSGQSSMNIRFSHVTLSAGTENLWWGPGAQNAILLSNNAPGFPHVTARTNSDGVNTRIGRFDAQYLLGRLRESDYFDSDSTNNVTALGGFVAEYTPRHHDGVHVGLARSVFVPTRSGVFSGSHVFRAFESVGNPNTSTKDSAKGPGADQITALFARWVVPAAHLESYVEWARFEQPKSLRDLLEYPQHSQGYTLGIQWAHPRRNARTFRLASEVTYLEPDATIRLRPVATTYTSRVVMQGYTNQGQPLGAAIGPGSSSQKISADLFGATWRLGTFATRIRWDDATLWTSLVPQVKNEDVSVLAGVRASLTMRRTRLAVQYADAVRLDYLYQDKIADPALGSHSGVDIPNRTLSFTLSTLVGH